MKNPAKQQMVMSMLRHFRLYAFAAIAMACFGGRNGLAASNNDHLMPVDGILDPAYYALLTRKLFLTPANFGRILDLPSGGSEIVFAIHSKQLGSSEQVFITCTRPDQELWFAGSDEQFRFTKDPFVHVTRVDVLFPKSAAVAVSEGIKRVLAQRRPPTKGNIVTVDGRAIEFSMEDQKRVGTRGILPPFARGKNGAALRRVTDLLRKYCEAKPAHQADLAKRIESEMNELAK